MSVLLKDSTNLSTVQHTTINITAVNAAVNHAPSGIDHAVQTNEDTPYVFRAVDFGFSDPDGNQLLALKITTLPTAGTLIDNGVAVSAGQFVSVADVDAGKLAFMPAPNANGFDYASFTYQVQDNGGTANGGVDLDQSPNTFYFFVRPVNDAPVAVNDSRTLQAGRVSGASSVLGNDVDVDGDPLSAVLVSGPTHGALTFNANGTFSYAADGSFSGADSFTYKVNDGILDSNTATVTLSESATYLWSALTNGQIIDPFYPTGDTLRFDDASISAAAVEIDINSAGGLTSVFAYGGKSITLAQFNMLAETGTNVTFANGSVLMIGDGTVGTVNDDLANTLTGGPGNDQLQGRGGNDTVSGGDGNDWLNGNQGDDDLSGGSGNDTMYGGKGNDSLNGNEGDDQVFGDAGNDIVHGGIGNDYVNGNQGDDQVFGDAGNDDVHGGKGNDTVDGGAGDDQVFGEVGDDVVIGGPGLDTLSGGPGSDRFLYTNLTDGLDTITDFTKGLGGDALDIRTVLVGYQPGTSNIRDFVQLTESAGNTTVSVDANGPTGGSSFVNMAVLQGVTGLLLEAMLVQGNLLVS